MVGRLVSFWDGLFSGALLVFGGVMKIIIEEKTCPVRISWRIPSPKRLLKKVPKRFPKKIPSPWMVIYHVGQQEVKCKIQVYRYVYIYIHLHCMSIPPIWCILQYYFYLYMFNVYFYTCPCFKKDLSISIHGIHLPPSLLSEIRTLSESSQQSFWWNPNLWSGSANSRHFCFRPLFVGQRKFSDLGEKGGRRRTTCSKRSKKSASYGRFPTLDSSTFGSVSTIFLVQ